MPSGAEQRIIETVSTRLRDQQKRTLCSALRAVPPEAPTLCEGWNAHRLAVHVWVVMRDPLSWPGMVVGSLEHLTESRARSITAAWSYPELIDRIDNAAGWIAAMPTDRLEGHRHALGEYWIHAQDVIRANSLPRLPVGPELAEALWRRAAVAGKVLHGREQGYVLRRDDGRTASVGRAPRTVVRGEPGELLCWVYGRTQVADVEVIDG